MKITEEDFAKAVDSRSIKPSYELLKRAHVGIAGLGGLGSNIAAALARSGIGHLTLVDFDTVELSNINRQLYSLKHIGMKKTEALSEILQEINPFCEISLFDSLIDEKNCVELFDSCSVVCEAFDNAECKADLVNTLLLECRDKYIVAASGMAGKGRANEIVTKRLGKRFYICGDGATDVDDGEGLSAARVMVCAGHQASKVIEIILNLEE